jgi:hypothetical protein
MRLLLFFWCVQPTDGAAGAHCSGVISVAAGYRAVLPGPSRSLGEKLRIIQTLTLKEAIRPSFDTAACTQYCVQAGTREHPHWCGLSLGDFGGISNVCLLPHS